MGLLKEQHETFANFFSAPSRDALRELLRKNIGETDYLDFKSTWPETSKLARHVLALANSGGGAIVVGVAEGADGTLEPVGLSPILDKSKIIPPLNSFLPRTVQFHVLDFSYAASEYDKLIGKAFQVLLVEDDPKQAPFLSLKDGDGIRANAVYVRSGTASTEAGYVELQSVINRRIETGHSNQPALDLDKHIGQLRSLDEVRPRNDCWFNHHFGGHEFDDRESSDFKDFLEEAYEMKKAQIIRLLGLWTD